MREDSRIDLVVAGLAAVLAVSGTVGPAASMPRPVTSSELIDFCQSATIADAAAKVGGWGWMALSREKLDAWRRPFIESQGGSVDLVGWRRGEKDEDGILSFWIARGPSAHHACAYVTSEAADLRKALSTEFGPPTSSELTDFSVMEYWKLRSGQISFSQAGSSVYVNISHSD